MAIDTTARQDMLNALLDENLGAGIAAATWEAIEDYLTSLRNLNQHNAEVLAELDTLLRHISVFASG